MFFSSVERVPEAELRGDVRYGVAGGLRRQGRRPGEPGVDLDGVVPLRARLERELHVALSDVSRSFSAALSESDLSMWYSLLVIVCEGATTMLSPVWTLMLRTFSMLQTTMPVVVPVPHHLVLDLLPVTDVLLDQDLVGDAEVQPPLDDLGELPLVPGDASSPAARACTRP